MLGETLAATSNPPRGGTAAVAAFTHVEVYDTPDPILDAWAELEAGTPCSTYQTRAWLLPWVETLGRRAGLTPCYVVARGPFGRVVAILFLGLYRRGPVKVATWLGGKDSNFNMPLLRAAQAWSERDVKRLLGEAAAKLASRKPDVFVLMNQPLAWHGQSNPFAFLPHQTSPSAAYGTALTSDVEKLLRTKLSGETRKKLRKKEARLSALGPVTHRIVGSAEDQRATLDAFLAQKVQRFRSLGIPSEFETPEMREFISKASPPYGDGIEIHALCIGERIVAVNGGKAHAGQWNGMFNSFEMDEEFAKSSPGELLMMRIITKACKDGLTFFDLGVGEARYKAAIADEKIALCDAIVPASLKGYLYARALSSRQAIKRMIKQNARLFALAKRLRAALNR